MIAAALALLLLLGPPNDPPAPPSPAPRSFRDYVKRPVVLGDAEYERLRSEVLQRCQLRPGTDAASAPWYFHYELGKELEGKGDPQRALDAFVEAAMRRERSAREARIYGMWFTDYYPYFHIARSHARLGNWECAEDALRVSGREGEMQDRERELAELRALVVGKQPSPRPRR